VKAIICPKCKVGAGFYKDLTNSLLERSVPYPLYQRSYLGEFTYISPRCLRCYEREETKETIGSSLHVG